MRQKKSRLPIFVSLAFNIVNSLHFEVIQHQLVDETKMQQVLRNLQLLKRPEMPDNKGV